MIPKMISWFSIFLVVIFLIANLLGCSSPNHGPGPGPSPTPSPIIYPAEFEGTWSKIDIVESQTYTISQSSLTYYYNILGSGDFTITSYDQTSNRILAKLNYGTGFYAIYPQNTIFYFKYQISGNQMYIDFDTDTYPITATSGPYTKS